MDQIQQFSLTLRQEADDRSGYLFRVAFDDTAIPDLQTDELPPLGAGAGPNPARLLAAAVANCLSASLLFAMRKFHNAPGRLTTRATAGHERLDRLLAQFEDFCLVTESVRQGVPVTVSVSDAGGALLHGRRAEPATATGA